MPEGDSRVKDLMSVDGHLPKFIFAYDGRADEMDNLVRKCVTQWQRCQFQLERWTARYNALCLSLSFEKNGILLHWETRTALEFYKKSAYNCLNILLSPHVNIVKAPIMGVPSPFINVTFYFGDICLFTGMWLTLITRYEINCLYKVYHFFRISWSRASGKITFVKS